MLAGPAAPGAQAHGCGNAADARPKQLSAGDARNAVVCLINAERRQHGVHELDANHKLQRSAQRHSDRMDGSGCFEHQCPGEPALESRLADVDYLGSGLSRWMCAEDIAWGYEARGTPRAIVDGWMHSPPHREVLLHPEMRDVGIGFAPGTPSGGKDPGGVYTADFGLRQG